MKEETGMGVIGSVLEHDVAQHCRTVCAINLQYLKEIFKNILHISQASSAVQ